MGKKFNVNNLFVDKNNNDRGWYKIVNFLSILLSVFFTILAYMLALDVSYQEKYLKKLDLQNATLLELIKTNTSEVDKLKEVIFLLKGDSNTQQKQLLEMLSAHKTSIMPKLIFLNGAEGEEEYSFNYENRSATLFDLKFSSDENLVFDYYPSTLEENSSQLLQIKNCTKPIHKVKVEYYDKNRNKYSQTVTIRKGRDIVASNAVEVK